MGVERWGAVVGGVTTEHAQCAATSSIQTQQQKQKFRKVVDKKYYFFQAEDGVE